MSYDSTLSSVHSSHTGLLVISQTYPSCSHFRPFVPCIISSAWNDLSFRYSNGSYSDFPQVTIKCNIIKGDFSYPLCKKKTAPYHSSYYLFVTILSVHRGTVSFVHCFCFHYLEQYLKTGFKNPSWVSAS